MNLAAPSLQISLSPDTVYTTSVPGQSSLATLTFTITNTGDDTQVSSVGILLPENLYVAGSLGSIAPVADAVWDFTASTTQGAFQASPASPVTIPANGTATFSLQNITMAQQSITPVPASISMKVKLEDGTSIDQTLTVNIDQATASINFFTAEPTGIAPGSSSTLSWNCTGIAYCYLSPPSDGQRYVKFPFSLQVSPAENTTYTLDAHATDLHLQQQVTISVLQPHIISFTSKDGDYVAHGGNVLLEWETSPETTHVTLTTNPQFSSIPLNLPLNTNGNPVSIGPLTQATTFFLKPFNDVVDGPVLSLNIDILSAMLNCSPFLINLGDPNSITLNWFVKAEVWKITGMENAKNQGTLVVPNPDNGTEYMLTAGTIQNPALQTLSAVVNNAYGRFFFKDFFTVNDVDGIPSYGFGIQNLSGAPLPEFFVGNIKGVVFQTTGEEFPPGLFLYSDFPGSPNIIILNFNNISGDIQFTDPAAGGWIEVTGPVPKPLTITAI